MEDMNSANSNETNQNEDENKMSMADRFVTAMFLPKEYSKLLQLKTSKVAGYLVLLLFLIAFIQYAIPALGALAGMGGVKDIILNQIPEFSLENGVFELGEVYEKKDENMGVYILVDTSKKTVSKEDVPEDMMEAILVSKNNMIVYNNVTGLGSNYAEEKFATYKDITINNQTIADASGVIYFILGCVFVILLIGVVVKYFFMALFYSVIMYLLSKTMMMDLTFGRVYKIALFAMSIGAIVVAVSYCINSPLFILASSGFNMLITVIIMNKALFQMKIEESGAL